MQNFYLVLFDVLASQEGSADTVIYIDFTSGPFKPSPLSGHNIILVLIILK